MIIDKAKIEAIMIDQCIPSWRQLGIIVGLDAPGLLRNWAGPKGRKTKNVHLDTVTKLSLGLGVHRSAVLADPDEPPPSALAAVHARLDEIEARQDRLEEEQ